jgi:hypothetical protein
MHNFADAGTPINMGEYGYVKTTLEIPDALFRRAKSAAAERGIPLRALVSEALAEKLRSGAGENKPWLKTFGKLRHLHGETARINRIIQEEFGQIEPEDWN